jgi:parvulin-like peptidyl-prolyl isomerase
MKQLFIPVLFASFLYAQVPGAPAPEPASDTVIATVEGKPLTYGELHSYISTLSQAQARSAMANIEMTIRQYALLTRLSKMGEEKKLDQKEPYVEILRAGRMQVLAQATISEQYNLTLVLPNEQEQFYKDHKAQYSKLKVKTIYIAFAANPSAAKDSGHKYRSEEEARKLATDLAAKLRAGADFAALVQQYSDDEESKKNNGDWGTVNAADNLPDDFKKAVLGLKIGEITDPMQRSGGFYIFKADSISEQPYSEVRDAIYNQLKETRMHDWMDKLQQSIPVKMTPAAEPAKPAGPPAGN